MINISFNTGSRSTICQWIGQIQNYRQSFIDLKDEKELPYPIIHNMNNNEKGVVESYAKVKSHAIETVGEKFEISSRCTSAHQCHKRV